MRSLRTAFGLLTTLPIRLPGNWQPGDSGRAAVWYPLVGLVIGALSWLTWRGFTLVLPPFVAAVLTLIVWVALTGGLHLDGLADCCDGLFASVASASRERRLEIMQDPHVGAFGAIGLILILLLKAAALATLTPAASLGIVLAASLSRWCILPAALLPAARPGGLGADFASGLRRSSIIVSALLPFGLAAALGLRGLFAALTGLAVAASVSLFARARIGGVTGDVFGMLVEMVEAAVLLIFVSAI
ncbi:MAG TPA: adenosylcobinamide-GDP ribazoletransferase [Anaerolineales bacterium]|jgi:adenosylcobinamide-GDP ribazoletransferase